jgi:hypothetical protein
MAAPTLAQYDKLFSQNISLSNQFKELIAVYKTKNASINSTVNSMISKINALVTNMGSSVFRPTELFFDRSITHSKTSLNIVADIQNRSRSNWVLIPEGNDAMDYPTPGSLTIIHPIFVYSMYGGYYESPRYKTDYSRTQMQFVVANYQATSDQINCELDNSGITPTSHGNWSVSARAFTCNTINISGLHPYKKLFVRFQNVNVTGKRGGLQNIVKYGGNSSFKLDRVCNYPEIKY